MPYSFSGYTVILADKKGYFKDNGLDVTVNASFPHGTATLQSIIDGEYQIAVCSETPFMLTFLNGNSIYALATTITADNHLAIVARKDRGIEKPLDLKGKKVGVTIGSNGEYFLDMVLSLNALSQKNISAIDLKPEAMVEKLMNGDVDAIATWNPQKCQAQKALGENGVTFNADRLYSPLFVVAATKDYVNAHPDIIKSFIKALHKGTLFINRNSKAANMLVAEEIGTTEALLNEIVPSYQFRLSLDQSFLTTLENQAHWALERKITRAAEMPNFLNAIYPDALQEIDPENVTLIR